LCLGSGSDALRVRRIETIGNLDREVQQRAHQ
jgi:hypothetical protein